MGKVPIKVHNYGLNPPTTCVSSPRPRFSGVGAHSGRGHRQSEARARAGSTRICGIRTLACNRRALPLASDGHVGMWRQWILACLYLLVGQVLSAISLKHVATS